MGNAGDMNAKELDATDLLVTAVGHDVPVSKKR